VPYRFVVDGEEWTSEDYTLDEMVAAEKHTQIVWSGLRPDREAEHVRAMVAAWYSRTGPADEADKRAGALTARQFKVTVMADDDRPAEYRDGIPVLDPKAGGDAPATT
jgi:hypothetical protein